MPVCTADLTRLALLIQRLLDAEILPEAEGARLLAGADAACRLMEEGDPDSALRHVEQVALFTEALVRTDALDLADGRAVIETANRMLIGDTDELA